VDLTDGADGIPRERHPPAARQQAGARRRVADTEVMEAWELRGWYGDFLDACNRHDLDDLRSFIDPAVRRAHLPGGVDAWLADLDELFRAFPDWRWRRIQLVIEDDRIAVHLRGSGAHRAAYRGIAATGRHVNVAEFAMYRVANGRIAEVSGLVDQAELLAQLGRPVG
jgi:predicted ester cyclase